MAKPEVSDEVKLWMGKVATLYATENPGEQFMVSILSKDQEIMWAVDHKGERVNLEELPE